MFRRMLPSLRLALLSLASLLLPGVAEGQRFYRGVVNTLHASHRAVFERSKPDASPDPTVDQLAKEIDWLEHQIETYGSIVPKSADVWGESRLAKHRRQYEEQLYKKFSTDNFDTGLQAAIRRSDQSFLSMALTLNAAAGGQASAPNLEQTLTLAGEPEIARPESGPLNLKNFDGDSAAISLEPTIVNDQLSRYLNHLNTLRRINEGDDIADTPGYSLNLVRIPVSVLPGHRTSAGYGAEASFTLRSVLSDDLLPSTVRNLVINDVVDQFALPLTQSLNFDLKTTQGISRMLEESEKRVGQDTETISRYLEKSDSYALLNADSTTSTTRKPEAILEYLRWRFTQIYFLQALLEDQSFKTLRNQDKNALNSIQISIDKASLNPADWNIAKSIFGIPDESNRIIASFSVSDLASFTHRILSCGKGTLPVKIANCKDDTDCTVDGIGCVPFLITFQLLELELLERALARRESPVKLVGVRKLLNNTESKEVLNLSQDIDDTAGESKSGFIDTFTGNLGLSKAIDVIRKADEIGLGISVDPFGFVDVAISDPAPPRSRRSKLPLAPSQYRGVYGDDMISRIVRDVANQLSQVPTSNGVVHVTDVRRVLVAETEVAYRFLSRPENAYLWEAYFNERLVQAIESSDFEQEVATIRYDFLTELPESMRHSMSGALAWALFVESVLLDQALLEDMRRVAEQRECGCGISGPLPMCVPNPSVESREMFKEYVRCRWPIHVFVLDPVTQDQNVADIFSRRRELQLALAVGVANGNVSGAVASRFARRLEKDMETIALNRTAVAFSHSNDHFGWRFYPRVQSPPTPGTLGVWWETLVGGPREGSDLRARQLEPGIRECVAVVVMPSFVPYVELESRANWFAVTNPRRKEWTMHDTMDLSGRFRSTQLGMQQLCASNMYRPEDLMGLQRTVGDLEKRLPFQSETVPVPYENTRGGFELFNVGVSDLGPELTGWYGAPGISVAAPPGAEDEKATATPWTTLFLVGDGFSVHETKVIAGGREIENVSLLSRGILQVTIPPEVNTIEHGVGESSRSYVDVHVATPYGVTNHLLVPAVFASPPDDEVEKIKTSITEVKKEVAIATRHAVAIELQATDVEKLQYFACKEKRPSNRLKFRIDSPDDANIHFRYSATTPDWEHQTLSVEVGVAVYRDRFLGPIRLVLAGEKVPEGEQDREKHAISLSNQGGTFALSVKKIAASITGDLEGQLSRDAIKDDKVSAEVVFFFRLVDEEGTPLPGMPIRAHRPLPLEATVAEETCDCCEK